MLQFRFPFYACSCFSFCFCFDFCFNICFCFCFSFCHSLCFHFSFCTCFSFCLKVYIFIYIYIQQDEESSKSHLDHSNRIESLCCPKRRTTLNKSYLGRGPTVTKICPSSKHVENIALQVTQCSLNDPHHQGLCAMVHSVREATASAKSSNDSFPLVIPTPSKSLFPDVLPHIHIYLYIIIYR